MVTLDHFGDWTNRRPGWTGVWLFLLAFIPRALPPAGNFLNVDAAGLWIGRVKTFVIGLQGGGWEQLAPTGHPGVTLLWLTSAAELFWQQWGQFLNFSHPLTVYIHWLKMPMMLMTSALVVVVWLYLRRAVRPSLALLMAVFLAVDPLYVIYSRELHLDALLTGYMYAGLAALWLAMRDQNWKWAVAGGGWLTLAVLTRMNGIIAWFFGLVFLVFWLGKKSMVSIRPIAAYLLASAVTAIVVWPAILTVPNVVVDRLQNNLQLGLLPHEAASNLDVIPWVRWLFYPIFIITREFPLFIGAAVMGLMASLRYIRDQHKQNIGSFLLVFGGIFLLASMVGPKKIDRYFLPGIISVTGLAAYGLDWLHQRMRPAWQGFLTPVLAVALIVQLSFFWHLQPYFQTYENLLGKLVRLSPMRTSAALTPAWGEGFFQADEFLRRRVGHFPSVASWMPTIHCVYGPPFDKNHYPFLTDPKVSCPPNLFFLSRSSQAEYILITRDVIAQGQYPGLQRDIQRLGWQPIHVIRLNNQPYVWIYQNTGGLAKEYPLADY